MTLQLVDKGADAAGRKRWAFEDDGIEPPPEPPLETKPCIGCGEGIAVLPWETSPFLLCGPCGRFSRGSGLLSLWREVNSEDSSRLETIYALAGIIKFEAERRRRGEDLNEVPLRTLWPKPPSWKV